MTPKEFHNFSIKLEERDSHYFASEEYQKFNRVMSNISPDSLGWPEENTQRFSTRGQFTEIGKKLEKAKTWRNFGE